MRGGARRGCRSVKASITRALTSLMQSIIIRWYCGAGLRKRGLNSIREESSSDKLRYFLSDISLSANIPTTHAVHLKKILNIWTYRCNHFGRPAVERKMCASKPIVYQLRFDRHVDWVSSHFYSKYNPANGSQASKNLPCFDRELTRSLEHYAFNLAMESLSVLFSVSRPSLTSATFLVFSTTISLPSLYQSISMNHEQASPVHLSLLASKFSTHF
jgi:hypothetical protein